MNRIFLLELFNSYHDRIKFTVDYGDENGINFLDVKLMKQEGKIIFDINQLIQGDILIIILII